MHPETIAKFITGTKCPVCSAIIKVAEATNKSITLHHNSMNPNCALFDSSLCNQYLDVMEGKVLFAEFHENLKKYQ